MNEELQLIFEDLAEVEGADFLPFCESWLRRQSVVTLTGDPERLVRRALGAYRAMQQRTGRS